MIQNKLLLGTFSLLVCSIISLAVLMIFSSVPAVRNGFILGILLSTANALLCFLLLHWTYVKSSKIFYGAYFGGVIWKLLVLGGVFYYLMNHAMFHAPATLISLAVMTFLLNMTELYFLPQPSD